MWLSSRNCGPIVMESSPYSAGLIADKLAAMETTQPVGSQGQDEHE